MARTIALADRGGLDTSIIAPRLRDQYPGAKVMCVAPARGA